MRSNSRHNSVFVDRRIPNFVVHSIQFSYALLALGLFTRHFLLPALIFGRPLRHADFLHGWELRSDLLRREEESPNDKRIRADGRISTFLEHFDRLLAEQGKSHKRTKSGRRRKLDLKPSKEAASLGFLLGLDATPGCIVKLENSRFRQAHVFLHDLPFEVMQ